MSTDKGTRRKRGQVTREAVVTAALEIVDREGLDKLTMKRLAEQIGCGTMTVYSHVLDRSDLENAIVARLLAEIDDHVEPGDRWADVLLRAAGTYREMALRHRNAFPLVLSASSGEPATAAHLANMAVALSTTGISIDKAYTLLGIADAFTTGYLLSETEAAAPSEGLASPTGAAQPTAIRRMRDLVSSAVWTGGLEAIIIGVQRTIGLPPVD